MYPIQNRMATRTVTGDRGFCSWRDRGNDREERTCLHWLGADYLNDLKIFVNITTNHIAQENYSGMSRNFRQKNPLLKKSFVEGFVTV